MAPGTGIALGILRDGKPTNLELTVGQFHGGTQVASNSDDQGPQSGKLGLAVSDLTAQARQQLEVPSGVQGVAIANVRPASPADDAGLQPGDVIQEVDRHPTVSASQFVSEMHQNTAGKEVLLLVWSMGNSSYRTLRPELPGHNG